MYELERFALLAIAYIDLCACILPDFFQIYPPAPDDFPSYPRRDQNNRSYYGTKIIQILKNQNTHLSLHVRFLISKTQNEKNIIKFR